MPCKFSHEWTFSPGESVCVKWGGSIVVGTYVDVAAKRSDNNPHTHPGHLVNVNGQEYIILNGNVGKGSPSGGRKKTRGTRKTRKTRRAQKPPRSRRTK
jgi:hypothetical protein